MSRHPRRFFILITLLLTLDIHAAPTSLNELLENWASSGVKDSTEALNHLPYEIQKSLVALHTSRSVHRASDLNPRFIFVSDSNAVANGTPYVLAFSMDAQAPPILETQSFNLNTGETEFRQIFWDRDGRMQSFVNPPFCFRCHANGKPLLLGVPETGAWPFALPSSHFQSQVMAQSLTEWNTRLQVALLDHDPRANLIKEWIRAAAWDDDPTWKRRIRSHQKKDVLDFMLEQNRLFREFMGLSWPDVAINPNSEPFVLTSRLVEALEPLQMGHWVDFLSIHVRPQSYELSQDHIRALKAEFPNLAEPPPRGWCETLLDPPFPLP